MSIDRRIVLAALSSTIGTMMLMVIIDAFEGDGIPLLWWIFGIVCPLAMSIACAVIFVRNADRSEALRRRYDRGVQNVLMRLNQRLQD